MSASSSAPTYFPAKVLKNISNTQKYTAVDGGLFANNPILLTILLLNYLAKNIDKKNVTIISIGTGRGKGATIAPNNYGILGWLKGGDIMDLSMLEYKRQI